MNVTLIRDIMNMTSKICLFKFFLQYTQVITNFNRYNDSISADKKLTAGSESADKKLKAGSESADNFFLI